ncbi:restriction endonuclease subunit M [Sinomonas cellulolyticus]|uniref:Restriction endonuclease n=1 Tax=Sinomonas cellulolyticus TaxID=2801916 RepID=A0ABS1K255_9MICC|nr:MULTISPECIES: DNA methyltransferase [Sinomonas]MBL0705543.1 restriction endonuclease [Sinomonas cellulolyticus]GHG41699.1 restriction endonuclease subunit M [Sinomonas sp. KCTC 49339]
MTKQNRLYYGDNLDVLRQYVPNESVDLVYLDPPFNSNRNYSVIFNRNGQFDNANSAQIEAFEDTWHWTPVTQKQFDDFINSAPGPSADALSAFRILLGENDAMAYLVNMAPRLLELHRVLKPTGTLFLHCDPTMSHYLKVLLDAVFDAKFFRNEIIWHYSGWNKKLKKHYESRHDVILMYAKSVRQFFSPQTLPWESEAEYLRTRKQKLHVDEQGRKYVMSDAGGGKRVKRYIEEAMQYGRPIDDIWRIDKLNNSASEALGYPTQKPVKLLERIIATASKPGDLVLDPFCGCGTTVDAAQRLDRAWIGIDITYIAIDLITKRLEHTYGRDVLQTVDINGIPHDMAGARALFERSPFDFERWAVSMINAEPNQKQVGDRGIDGVARFPVDSRGKLGKVVVSVKGGRKVTPSVARDLRGTVERTGDAHMGILITMDDITKGVREEIARSGYYTFPVNNQDFPVLQHISVKDLLAGKLPLMPGTILPYIKAQKVTPKAGADELF